jgi:hypothetical protein
MSRENVEVIEGAYQAVRGRRMSEWAHRLLPPEIEWHPVPQSPDFEVRRGPQGVSSISIKCSRTPSFGSPVSPRLQRPAKASTS